GNAGVAGGIGGGRGEAVAAVGQRAGGAVAPGTAGARRHAAQERSAVIDLDRAVGLGAAGERQHGGAGNAVADEPGVGGERGDARRRRRHAVDGHGERGGGGAGVAGGIGGGRGEAVRAVRQRAGGAVAPAAAAARQHAAQERSAVIDLDRAV